MDGIIVLFYDKKTLANKGFFIRPMASRYFVDYANRFSAYQKKRFIRTDGTIKKTQLLKDIIWTSKYNDIRMLRRIIKNLSQ